MTLLNTALIGLFVLSGISGQNSLALAKNAAEEPPPTYTVSMTAYNAVPEQTDGDPHITASGAYSNPEIVAARSRDLAEQLPFGTVIEVSTATSSKNCGLHVVGDEVGLRVIADTMHARMQNKIDILLDSKKTARTFGVCEGVDIKVVGKIDIKDMPDTQDELRAQIGVLEKAQPQTLAIFK